MPPEPTTLFTPADHAARDSRPGTLQWLTAVAVCVATIIGGTLIINLLAREIEARNKVDLLVLGSALQARLSRELNSVLFLSSGLSSYLAVRRASLDRTEVQSILEALHRDSRHVRNFAVAVGYRITYIHPVRGNEKAIGLHYPDVPAQWPDVKRAVDTGQPVLIGPLALVQGGSGLIYRVPIFADGKYWGLLSSVIDTESLLNSALSETAGNGISIAIRGTNGQGMQGAVFHGDAALFEDRNAQRIDLTVPGGKWVIALRPTAKPGDHGLGLMRGLVWLLGLTLGWSTLMVLAQRAQLARLALFDPLTGLPNRVLVHDRVNHAMSILRRDPSRGCLLLFVDLDGFKQVNDRLGHKAGDVVLQRVALRIADAVRDTDTVSRWGGDEFIVFMEHFAPGMKDDVIDKIRSAVEAPVTVGMHTIKVGVSIGAAQAPADGNTLDELARAADERMYADKAARKPASSIR